MAGQVTNGGNRIKGKGYNTIYLGLGKWRQLSCCLEMSTKLAFPCVCMCVRVCLPSPPPHPHHALPHHIPGTVWAYLQVTSHRYKSRKWELYLTLAPRSWCRHAHSGPPRGVVTLAPGTWAIGARWGVNRPSRHLPLFGS